MQNRTNAPNGKFWYSIMWKSRRPEGQTRVKKGAQIENPVLVMVERAVTEKDGELEAAVDDVQRGWIILSLMILQLLHLQQGR